MSFGEALAAPRGEAVCKHCGKGQSDHVLPLSEQRCFHGVSQPRFEKTDAPRAWVDEGSVLDASEHALLKELFTRAVEGRSAVLLMRRHTMESAMRKLHVMHERAKAQKAGGG